MSENLKCPLCGGDIIELDKSYSCANSSWDREAKKVVGCEFKIWKEFLTQKISVKDLTKLLKNEPVHKSNLVGKSGKAFEAGLKLDPSMSGHIELEFTNSKKAVATADEDSQDSENEID